MISTTACTDLLSAYFGVEFCIDLALCVYLFAEISDLFTLGGFRANERTMHWWVKFVVDATCLQCTIVVAVWLV